MHAFSPSYSKIIANLLNAYPCLPIASPGDCFLSRIYDVRLDAILTALSIGVSHGTLKCVGYSFYFPVVCSPPVDVV